MGVEPPVMGVEPPRPHHAQWHRACSTQPKAVCAEQMLKMIFLRNKKIMLGTEKSALGIR